MAMADVSMAMPMPIQTLAANLQTGVANELVDYMLLAVLSIVFVVIIDLTL